MKTRASILGIILILVGITGLAYQGFTYTKYEQVAQIGNLQVTANTEKTVYFPPIVGGLVLVAGIALVIFGNKK